MTVVAYLTPNYITSTELDRAYRLLEHPTTTPTWSATLLITRDLVMHWACPVRIDDESPEDDLYSRGASHAWHIIAGAGELDWPPLRDEDDIWPALRQRHPLPTGELAEQQAKTTGHTTEEMWRNQMRHHYLSASHVVIGGRPCKRNPNDVNFDPIVRDWMVTARELVDFIDSHPAPKLTAEQRVMTQGARLAAQEASASATKTSLAHLMRNAAAEQGPQPRRGFKSDLARWAGVSRPTVDAWLAEQAGPSGHRGQWSRPSLTNPGPTSPGWYQRMARDWAVDHFDFPADPDRLQVHVASDGSEWTYELLAAGEWDITGYPTANPELASNPAGDDHDIEDDDGTSLHALFMGNTNWYKRRRSELSLVSAAFRGELSPLIQTDQPSASTDSPVPEPLRGIVPSIGSIWVWEPLLEHARATLQVTDVKWNGEEAFVETLNLDKPDAERSWNPLGHWVQATVLIDTDQE